MTAPVFFETTHTRLNQLCNQRNCVIITDTEVAKHYAITIQNALPHSHLLTFPPGEKHKTRTTKQQLEDQLLDLNCKRDTLIVAFGGGISLDIAGFTAATYLRGVDVIYYPTTLLAMVDACIGGKTGVNTSQGKNLIGCIRQPTAIIINPVFLESLPIQEMLNGFAEMIKQAALADAVFFNQLTQIAGNWQSLTPDQWQPLIKQALQIKQTIVECDYHEQGLRHCLNFGHTIGHAIEHCTRYSIPHGQAIAWGMLVESYIGKQLNLIQSNEINQLHRCLKNFGLCQQDLSSLDQQQLINALQYDKKTTTKHIQLALISKIGQTTTPILTTVTEQQCLDAWTAINCMF